VGRTILPPNASLDLRAEWEASAPEFIAWARRPGHDSYWQYHRAQFLPLLPDAGHLTLDIGCGEGRFARDLAKLGHNVVGVDGSPTMIAAARDADPTIEFRVVNAARLPFDDAVADLAIAFMSLQDVDEFESAVHEIGRVLVSGGRFCMAIVHPFNSAGQFEGREPDSPFTIRGSYLGSFRYVDDVVREGLHMRFASAHRPLQAYVDAIADAGMLVERIREPAVPDHAIAHESTRRWQRVPLLLHIRAVRV
jgi:SAM-dependent methyltransferase